MNDPKITGVEFLETMLRECEQRFRALIELSSDWYWEQDAELRFTHTLSRRQWRGGISEADHVGKRRWELPRTEILGETWEQHQAVLAARASFHDLLLRRTSTNGSPFYLRVSGEPFYDARGNFAGYRGVAKDVTDRYQAEHALRETEARLRATLDATPAAICFYDLAERILIANSAYAELVERSPNELTGRTIRAIAGERAYSIAKPYIDRALGGEAASYERRRRRSDGTTRDLQLQIAPYRDDSGIVIGACAMIVDVTELKETQRALQASEARFRALTQLSSDWFWEQDENFRFVDFSPELEAAAGVSADSQLGKTRWEVASVGVTPEQWAEHRATLEAHLPFRDFEYRRAHARGDVIWVSVSGLPIFDSDGSFRGYRGIGRNITERKKAEEALRNSEERFRSLTTLSSDYYWETDAEHRFSVYEHGSRSTKLFSREQVLGKTRWDFDTLQQAEIWKTLRALLDAHLPFRDFEFARTGADGGAVHFAITGEPIFDGAGNFVGYRGVGRDISDRKRAEEALHEGERRIRLLLRRLTHAQEAERRRIAGHLHDVVSQNLSALGLDLESTGAQLQQAGMDEYASRFPPMAALLKETLDALRQTMSDLRPPLLDDYGLVAALESHARLVANRSGMQVAVEGPRLASRPPANVELALFRIAQEALANAVKHARASRARVVLSQGGGRLRLAIEDDGEGFFRPAGARAEQRGGWGLPLMRERAEEVGGALRIEFLRKGTRIITDVPHVDPHHPG